MPNQPREQIQLFKEFLLEFTSPITCIFCYSFDRVKSTFANIPGEEFDRYTNLCESCRSKYQIKMKGK